MSVEAGGAEDVEPVVAASDAVSGVDRVEVEVSVDGSEWRPHLAPLVAEAGRAYVFRARAVDVAGNWSGWVQTEPVVAAPVAPEEDEPDEQRPTGGTGSAPPVPVKPAVAPLPAPVAVLAEEPPAPQIDPPVMPPPKAPQTLQDPRLRITRVVTRRRGVVHVVGTAARELQTTANVTLKVGTQSRSRRVTVGGGRWKAVFRTGRNAAPRAVTVTARATGSFASGTARWRANANKPRSPLAHHPDQ
ncbi:MAG TPA: hypothetical protein VGW10_01870 [Solirubrobacteraceae bacterium]|nr:hypothetical protein [Solirubrobacteraceae bacterium]